VLGALILVVFSNSFPIGFVLDNRGLLDPRIREATPEWKTTQVRMVSTTLPEVEISLESPVKEVMPRTEDSTGNGLLKSDHTP